MTRCTPIGVAVLLSALSVPAQAPTFVNTPLLFEANVGQFAAAARFVAKGPGWRQFLTADAAVLALDSPGRDRCLGLFTRFVGGRARAISGADPAPTRLCYLMGQEPHPDVPTFHRVRYDDLWPGVDLVYYADRGHLRYDFVVAPGADPARIRLRFDGADAVTLSPDGELVLATAFGDVRHSAPVLYQQHGDERRPVAGRFLLRGDEVGFEAGEVDPRLPLVIDPILSWATLLGGSAVDNLFDLAVDGAGNVYATGTTYSTDLPVTPGAFQTGRLGRNAAFAAKVDASGSSIAWCTYLGGALPAGGGYTALAEGNGIAVLADGSVVVVGRTSTSDFPTTPGAHQTSITAVSDSVDCFLTRIAPNGQSLVWSTFFGGSSNAEVLQAVAVGPGQDLYVAGASGAGNSFPTTPGAYQRTGNGGEAGVVARFTAAGALVWSTYLRALTPVPAPVSDHCYAVDVDGSGRVYVAGLTRSTTWPTPGGFQTSHGGGYYDLFVARLRADATALDYSSLLGGSDTEGTFNYAGIAALDDGRCWVVSSSRSPDFPVTPGAFQPQHRGNGDGTVTCIDTTLAGAGSLLWSTCFGGSDLDRFCDVVVDAQGHCAVSGSTRSSDFPTAQAWQVCRGGSEDYALAGFDSGGALLWSTYVGGGNREVGLNNLGALAVDAGGNLYLGGSTGSADFATAGAAQTVLPGNAAAGCIVKFAPQPTPTASAVVRAPCAGSNLAGGLLAIDPRPSVGSTFRVGIDDPTHVGGLPPGSLTFWLLSLTRNSGHPCGVPLPGMGVGGSLGEALIDPGNLFIGSVQVWPGPGTPAVHRLTIPCRTFLNGAVVYTQGAMLSPTAQVLLTDALDLTAGW